MNKTSIIIPAYDTTRLQRWITSACLGNIAKYTERDEYELIFVDQRKEGLVPCPLNERFQKIDIDKWLKPKENIGCSAAMNLGAKNTSKNTEYLCFMHNDVLVWEGWLKTLRSFIEEDYCDVIFPTQSNYDRNDIKLMEKGDRHMRGNDDAGLILTTKEHFKESGGWDERFKTIYMEAAFRRRLSGRVHCTAKCVITHICCGTLWAWSDEEEAEAYSTEALIFNALGQEKKKINYLK